MGVLRGFLLGTLLSAWLIACVGVAMTGWWAWKKWYR